MLLAGSAWITGDDPLKTANTSSPHSASNTVDILLRMSTAYLQAYGHFESNAGDPPAAGFTARP